eukprot:4847939-Amphidinium_carterae.1
MMMGSLEDVRMYAMKSHPLRVHSSLAKLLGVPSSEVPQNMQDLTEWVSRQGKTITSTLVPILKSM